MAGTPVHDKNVRYNAIPLFTADPSHIVQFDLLLAGTPKRCHSLRLRRVLVRKLCNVGSKTLEPMSAAIFLHERKVNDYKMLDQETKATNVSTYTIEFQQENPSRADTSLPS